MAAVNPRSSYGIDDQRLGQLLRRAGQLAQNQHAVEIVARGDELLRHKVHAVVQRRDDAEVREPVERHELRQLRATVFRYRIGPSSALPAVLRVDAARSGSSISAEISA